MIVMKKSHQTNKALVYSVGIYLVQIEVVMFAWVKMNCRKVIKYIASSAVASTEMQISKKMYQHQGPYLSLLELMLLVRLDYNNETERKKF